MTLQTQLTDALKQALADVEIAARRQDLPAVEVNTRRAIELQALSRELSDLIPRIEAALGENRPRVIAATPSPAPAPAQNQLRRLPVQVTGGMIRQNLLTLTEHVKFQRIKVGEHMIVRADVTGEQFATMLLDNSYKLQERGAVGRFYKDAGIQEGDIVVLVETAPGQWTLKKGEPGEWDGHFRYKRVLSRGPDVSALL